MIRQSLEDTNQGIQVKGIYINNIRYTDDLVCITSTREELQNMLIFVNNVCKKYGKTINIRKTKGIIKHSDEQGERHQYLDG